MEIGNISIYKSVVLGGSCGPENVSFSLNPTDLQALNQRLTRFGSSEQLTLDNLSPRLLSLAIFGDDREAGFITSIVKNADDPWYNLFGWFDGALNSADITLRLPANATAEQIARLREVLSALRLQCNLPTPQTLPTPLPIPAPPQPPVINPPVQPPPPPPPQPRDGGGVRPAPDAAAEPEDVEAPQPVPAGVSLGSANYDPDTGRMGVVINVGGVELTDDNDIEIITSSPAIRVIGSAGRQGSSAVSLALNTASAEPGRTYTITVKIDGDRIGSVSITIPEESEKQGE